MSSTVYDIVHKFEQAIADYAGCRHAIAVDSCTNALFLCCIYKQIRTASIPAFTYPGVACSIINAGAKVTFDKNAKWKGAYQLYPHLIYDSALRFKRNMFIRNSLYCLSFHHKKHLPIGRGGMILTNSYKAYSWFKKARFDGRSSCPLPMDNIEMTGWNMYMTPEQAARGLLIFDGIKNKELEDLDPSKQGYPDLSEIKAYRK